MPHLLLIVCQFHVDVTGILLDAICTTHEAVEVIPHQALQLTRLKDVVGTLQQFEWLL